MNWHYGKDFSEEKKFYDLKSAKILPAASLNSLMEGLQVSLQCGLQDLKLDNFCLSESFSSLSDRLNNLIFNRGSNLKTVFLARLFKKRSANKHASRVFNLDAMT